MESKTDRYGNTFFYTYDQSFDTLNTMRFSETLKQSILSDFSVTVTKAMLFKKTNNLNYLRIPVTPHSIQVSKQNSNRKQFRDHDNKVTDYDYDKLNRLIRLTQAGLGAFEWSYNAAGLPKSIVYPNGSQANYDYDDANRIALIDNKQSGVTVTSHAYEYDLNGNRDKLTESNIDASQITTYEYDDADRLTKVFYPTKVASYTLDKVGNRELELIDSGGVLNTIDYVYNSRDQLTSVTDSDGLDITYDYDPFGNQTEKDTNGVITTFDYTARQRVKSITIGTASPNEYQYDYAGQRINSQANGMEKRYLYEGLTLVAETNAIGNTLATYHYGQRRQLAETRNTTNSFYLADALGTNVAITNQDGSIQNRMDYDVWGNLNQETASSDSPFGFTGYIKDEDTDLYYANARYYDSFTGRFLREDSLNGDVNTPPSLHRYLYGYANPTSWIDPTGKGNDTPHFYESLLLGDVVQLDLGQNLAFALGNQIGDEFSHHDAVSNSTSYITTVSGFSNSWISGALIASNPEYISDKIKDINVNNCGGHALCSGDPVLVRRAVKDYIENEISNIAQYATADHTFTDSFYHIEKKTLNAKDKYKSHTVVIGHLFEGTNTDKAYRYHRNKRLVAFEQRAIQLYQYAVKNGLTTLTSAAFENRLEEAVNLLNQKNRELLSTHMEYGLHGSTFPHYKADFDAVNPNNEFYYMQDILEERGITDIPSTQSFELSHNIYELLSSFSKNQLQEIAKVMNPNAESRINQFDKERLVTFISYRYDQYQTKSKEYIYENVKKQESDSVIENSDKPGTEEVSQ